MPCDGQPKSHMVDPDERREQLRSTALQDQLNAMVKRLNQLEHFAKSALATLSTTWQDSEGNVCITHDQFINLDNELREVMTS